MSEKSARCHSLSQTEMFVKVLFMQISLISIGNFISGIGISSIVLTRKVKMFSWLQPWWLHRKDSNFLNFKN